MLKIADFVIRNRFGVIAFIVVTTLLLGWQAMKVDLNADFSTYLRKDDPLVQQYNRVGEIFGGNSIGIALITADDVFSKESLSLVARLTEAYEKMPEIAYVTSLTNVIDFRKTPWGLEVGKLLNGGDIPQSPQELAQLKSYVLSKDRYVENLVSEDAKATAIVLRFASTKNKVLSHFTTSLKIKQITDSIIQSKDGSRNDLKIYFGGMPFLIFNMTTLITHNMEVLVPLMVLILVVILYLGFRTWAGVVLPLLVVIISVVWVVGFMGFFNLKFDLLTGIMPVVLLALGSADGIHLMKRYFERRRGGEPARDAARFVYQEMGTPILLTTITTMVGFASLAISDFTVIRQFGLLTALGVLLALVITLTLLPALLSFGIRFHLGKAKVASRAWLTDKLGSFIYNKKVAILLGSLLIIFVSLLAIPKIVKDVDWTLCLAKGSSPYHAEMMLREKFGGSLPIQILIDGDIKEPAVLKMMRVMERRLETIPLVSKSESIAGIIAEMNYVMNDRYVIPETRQGVSNLWFLIESEDMIRQMVARGEKEALLQAKLDTWHTSSLVAAVDSINIFLANLPKDMVVVDLSGVSGAVRDKLKKLQAQRMVENLRWDLQKYGFQPSSEKLQQMVSQVLNSKVNTQTVRRVQEAVTAYLQTPEAEIALSDIYVRRINRDIESRLLKQQIPDKKELSRIIQRQVPGTRAKDADWLAESLAEVVRVAIGENRVAPVLANLEKKYEVAPLKKENFRRDIKGDLWAANENLLVIDALQAKKLFTTTDFRAYNEVSWQFMQTGLAPVLNRMEEELTPTQTESLFATLIIVIILLSLIFRSPAGGLLSVIPISITILINFAVMGYTGIGLDSFTAMIASIAIGLGIDYAIHFVSRFRDELKIDGDELAALQRTLGTTGISIVINALSVGLGFLALLAAGGQHIRRFGGLTALTMIVSAILTLVLLPSIFLWIKPRFFKNAVRQGQQAAERRDAEVVVVPSGK
ncbi:MAG: MMPL family transporter [Calditrichaeota bacterium]|nr:MMPL family transporter [Calditrichota bacterium]